MSAAQDIEEKGFPPAMATVNPVPDDQIHSQRAGEINETPISTAVDEPINPKLASFRNLVGIESHPALAETEILRRPAPNLGIYGRTCHAERHAKLDFKTWNLLINGCLGFQIIIAASLTALGAAGGNQKAAVTVFGAVNTVIAGFLTYLKGSGLPNRLRYYQNQWTRVREYIEQRERDFGCEGCDLDLEYEVNLIETMYEDVRADVQANTPDSYVGTNEAKRNYQSSVPRHPFSVSERRTEREGELPRVRTTIRDEKDAVRSG